MRLLSEAARTHIPKPLTTCHTGEPWRKDQRLVLCCSEPHAAAERTRLRAEGYVNEYDLGATARWVRPLGYYGLQLRSSFFVTDLANGDILRFRGRRARERAVEAAYAWNTRMLERRETRRRERKEVRA